MAALIKSSTVASKPHFLLDPTARINLPEHVHAEELLSAQPEGRLELPIEDVDNKPDGKVMQQEPGMETESAAYVRLMEHHKELLTSLEENTRQEAYAAGYAEGENAGYAAGLNKGSEEGAERYAQAVAMLEQIAAAGNKAVSDGLVEAEPLIGAIVFQIVCKIVGDVLETPQGVQSAVMQALADVQRSEVVSIKVSPGDLDLLQAHAKSLQPAFARLQSIGLEADERIALGGCIVQLKGGHIDARIETQLRAFAQSLKDAILRRA